VSPLEARMAHLEGAYEQTTERLAGFDLRFDSFDRKLDSMRADLTVKIDEVRKELEARIDGRFMWTIGVVMSTWITTMLGILALLARH